MVDISKYPGTASTYIGKLDELMDKKVKISPYQVNKVKERCGKEVDPQAEYKVIGVNPETNTVNIVEPRAIKNMPVRELDVLA